MCEHDYREMDSHTEYDKKTDMMSHTVWYKCRKCGDEQEETDGDPDDDGM